MKKTANLRPEKVFTFFEELCAIPHGSGDMEKIADYCVEFAKDRNLKFYRDSTDNVVIFKNGTKGFEKSEPVILQGHLDMVCQKTAEREIDFLTDPIEIFEENGFIKARGTTLGADNGIAVAMVLSILDSDDLAHPPIEAVFTTDEEIGMLGASALDMSVLSGRKMINMDSEEDDVLTVSCAGGEDFIITAKPDTKATRGLAVALTVSGLQGGHSGVEIDKGRVNSNILAGRILRELSLCTDFDIISVKGGDKGNAIPLRTEILLQTESPERLIGAAEKIAEVIKTEIAAREPLFKLSATLAEEKFDTALSDSFKDKLIFALSLTPNGICEWSREIEGLVETSLSLGILIADSEKLIMHYALRSNKETALHSLSDRLSLFAKMLGFDYETGGYYPPWEYKENSLLRSLYCKTYKEICGSEVRVEAIHAGLECAVFADKIRGIDCIAIGPSLFDVHTVNERMEITSVEKIYKIVTKLLSELK